MKWGISYDSLAPGFISGSPPAIYKDHEGDIVNKRRFLDSKGAIYLCAFLLPFIMVQVFYFLCGIYPYGSSSILTGDMDLEFVNFYTYFINIFKTKNDFSYMLAKTLGGDYPGLAAFQLHDPLLFVLFLFPGDRIAAGIELLFALQVSIAGLSASVLLNNRYRKSWMSVLFSTAYAFCSFFFGYLVLTIYFGCLAILPLVIYFFLKSLDEQKAVIPYTILTVLYIYINFHMGFMLVIFLFLLYVSRIIADTSYLKKFKQFVVSGVIILLIDGFFLIRTGLSLLGEKTTTGADYGIYRRFPLNQLFANLFSGSSRNDLMPLIYCSVAAVFFALIYFMSGKISLKNKLANLFLLASVAISMWINLLDAVWHGFNNPEGFYWRYAFFISLTLIVLGYNGFIVLLEGNTGVSGEAADIGDHGGQDGRRIIRILIAALIILLYMVWCIITHNAYMDKERIIVNTVLVTVISVCVFLGCKEGAVRRAGLIVLLFISFADMLYNSKTVYLKLNSNDGDLPQMAKFKDDYNDIRDAVDYIKAEDGGMYRIEKDFDRAVNDPAMFDYIGLSHDSSCEKDEVIDWLRNFGFCRIVYYTHYNGGSTSWVDDFFGIRYFVSRFDGINKPYEHTDYTGKYHVFENDDALPMAFAAPDRLKSYDFSDDNTFEKQNSIAACWDGADKIYREAEYELSIEGVYEQEAGHYIRTQDEGYIVYRIDITENKPLYFFFDAPGRQGGEVIINGESKGPYFTETHWNVMCAGIYDEGSSIELKMKVLGDDLTISDACFYYEDTDALKRWSKLAHEYTEGIGELEEISSSHLCFDTSLPDDKTVIMTLPYDECWKIKCDGKSVKPDRAMEILLSMDIPAGEHSIEMKYVPRGTIAGLIVSCVGIVLFAWEIVCALKRREE